MPTYLALRQYARYRCHYLECTPIGCTVNLVYFFGRAKPLGRVQATPTPIPRTTSADHASLAANLLILRHPAASPHLDGCQSVKVSWGG